MYLLCENRQGIIIDPFTSEEAFCWIAERITKLDGILLSHEHYDHISGTSALREKYKCPVICGERCMERLGDPTKNFSRYLNAYASLQTAENIPEKMLLKQDYTTCGDWSFRQNTEIVWQKQHILLTETPGHSPGSICILVNNRMLFSGDTLLPQKGAMTRFPDGSKSDDRPIALPYLRSLPPDTIVYPGHGKRFLLGEHPSIA